MIVGYWEIPGKCQVIRFLLEINKANYTDKRYTFRESSEWFEKDKLSLGLNFPNLPYLIDGTFQLTESNAIVNYLLDKYQKNQWKGIDLDTYKVDELKFLFTDLQSLGYLATKGDQSSLDKFLEKIKSVYSFLQLDKKFLLGYFTVADLYSWEALSRMKIQWPDIYSQFADKFDLQILNIESIPEIKFYIESGRCLNLQAQTNK